MKEQKNLKRLGALAIAVAIIAISTASFTSADEEDTSQKGPKFKMELRAEMQEKMQEIHEQMDEVMENGDYQDWYDLVTQSDKTPPALDVITEENFSRFVEMWKIREEGRQLMEQARLKMEEARAIGEELGLKTPDRRPNNPGFGKGMDGAKFMNKKQGTQK